MKKALTLCLFAFALLLSTQTTFAQDKEKINEIASIKTKELRSLLKFNDNALEKIYHAFQAYEAKSLSIKEHLTVGSEEYKNANVAVEENLQKAIESALGPDLFKRYLIIQEQKK